MYRRKDISELLILAFSQEKCQRSRVFSLFSVAARDQRATTRVFQEFLRARTGSYEVLFLLLFSHSSRTLWYLLVSFSSSASERCSISIISLCALSIDLMTSSSFK